MNRPPASLLLLLLLAGCTAAEAEPAAVTASPHACPVLRVVDGDTFRVPTSCLTPPAESAIRVLGIDTPELRGRCEAERVAARAARAFAEAALAAAAEVLVVNPKPDKYAGRFDALVILVDRFGHRRSLGEMLIEAGHARAYDGGRRQGWC